MWLLSAIALIPLQLSLAGEYCTPVGKPTRIYQSKKPEEYQALPIASTYSEALKDYYKVVNSPENYIGFNCKSGSITWISADLSQIFSECCQCQNVRDWLENTKKIDSSICDHPEMFNSAQKKVCTECSSKPTTLESVTLVGPEIEKIQKLVTVEPPISSPEDGSTAEAMELGELLKQERKLVDQQADLKHQQDAEAERKKAKAVADAKKKELLLKRQKERERDLLSISRLTISFESTAIEYMYPASSTYETHMIHQDGQLRFKDPNQAITTLKKIAEILKKHPELKIEIHSFTIKKFYSNDTPDPSLFPYLGSSIHRYYQEESREKATIIKNYLIQYGLSPGRIRKIHPHPLQNAFKVKDRSILITVFDGDRLLLTTTE